MYEETVFSESSADGLKLALTAYCSDSSNELLNDIVQFLFLLMSVKENLK